MCLMPRSWQVLRKVNTSEQTIAVVGHDARGVDATPLVMGHRMIVNVDELPVDAAAGLSIVPAAHSKAFLSKAI